MLQQERRKRGFRAAMAEAEGKSFISTQAFLHPDRFLDITKAVRILGPHGGKREVPYSFK